MTAALVHPGTKFAPRDQHECRKPVSKALASQSGAASNPFPMHHFGNIYYVGGGGLGLVLLIVVIVLLLRD